MPRYFFHIRREDKLNEDPEGTELASVEEAQKEANLAAREILADRLLPRSRRRLRCPSSTPWWGPRPCLRRRTPPSPTVRIQRRDG